MKKPNKFLLWALAALITVGMLRLGFWQLTRADTKNELLIQLRERAAEEAVSLSALTKSVSLDVSVERFRAVEIIGKYDVNKSVYIDNQVIDSRVGYLLLTPLKLRDSEWWVLVNRGWLPAGLDRSILPAFKTESDEQTLLGRINKLPAKPPLWNEQYSVVTGKVWQYLPVEEYSQKMGLKVLPLVVELATVQNTDTDTSLTRRWSKIDDKSVAMHRAYAFQWFAMAAAFLIACCVLAFASGRPKS